MKRGTLILAAAATAVAALAISPATAGDTNHAACQRPVGSRDTIHVPAAVVVREGYHAFLYCGFHWASNPIKFKVDPAGAPISAAAFADASKAAAAAWNEFWPEGPTTSTSCSSTTLLCYDSAVPQVVIKFAALAEGTIGQAELAVSGSTITGAVITLNTARSWRTATGTDTATGEVPGVVGAACCGAWFDVQDVVTHELGHVIGLEDVGNEGACGADAIEVLDYGQTMYGCLKAGDTSKRTLSFGDVLGLERVSEDYS